MGNNASADDMKGSRQSDVNRSSTQYHKSKLVMLKAVVSDDRNGRHSASRPPVSSASTPKLGPITTDSTSQGGRCTPDTSIPSNLSRNSSSSTCAPSISQTTVSTVDRSSGTVSRTGDKYVGVQNTCTAHAKKIVSAFSSSRPNCSDPITRTGNEIPEVIFSRTDCSTATHSDSACLNLPGSTLAGRRILPVLVPTSGVNCHKNVSMLRDGERNRYRMRSETAYTTHEICTDGTDENSNRISASANYLAYNIPIGKRERLFEQIKTSPQNPDQKFGINSESETSMNGIIPKKVQNSLADGTIPYIIYKYHSKIQPNHMYDAADCFTSPKKSSARMCHEDGNWTNPRMMHRHSISKPKQTKFVSLPLPCPNSNSYNEDDNIQNAAEHSQFYDGATWRMYNRITNARRKRMADTGPAVVPLHNEQSGIDSSMSLKSRETLDHQVKLHHALNQFQDDTSYSLSPTSHEDNEDDEGIFIFDMDQ